MGINVIDVTPPEPKRRVVLRGEDFTMKVVEGERMFELNQNRGEFISLSVDSIDEIIKALEMVADAQREWPSATVKS